MSLAVIIVKLPTTVTGNEPEFSSAGPERTAEIEPRGWTTGRILPVQDFVRGVPPGGLGTLRYPTLRGGKEVVVPTTYHNKM